MKTKVFKFGGKFFKAEIISSFKEIFQNETSNSRTLFIVSAMGGMTRLLRLLFEANTEKLDKNFKDLIISLSLGEFHRTHLELISKLFTGDESNDVKIKFERIFIELRECINVFQKGHNEGQFYASILKFGELSSSMILSNHLRFIGVENTLFDAREYLLTNSDYEKAEVIKINPSFKDLFLESKLLVTQGFIGRNQEGQDTVLGFDGSDTSTSYFAGEFEDEKEVYLVFWKDVKGFFKEDPSESPNADILDRMWFPDYEKLSTRPIRLDAVSYALKKGIRVYMRNFLSPYDIPAEIYN